MEKIRIILVNFSESFAQVWDGLARDLGVEWEQLEGRDPDAAGPDVAAFLLAAGGAEGDVVDWLDNHQPPAGVPTFAIGSDTGRRMATHIVSAGASDYFALPEDLEILRNSVAAAVERRRVAMRRMVQQRGEAKNNAFASIIGESPAIKKVLARAARILQRADATILIDGETGTGKELVARGIHDGGPRRGAPFVAVNCSALPDRLIESELFGHERGAFTDATSTKPGLFEVADGGTIFLDEIGDLPLEVQAKFLRVLQDKQVRRVGGTKSRKVDLRIIAATNEDLPRHIQDGKFREDLYFRLSVITLTLPPLRERGDDLMLIVDALLKELAEHHDLPVPDITPQARRSLLDYHWPGNVRELRNAVERALLLSAPGKLDPRELRPQSETIARQGGPIPFPARLDDITVAAANAMLGLANGNRSEAARRLGISRRRLRRLLEGGRGEL
ncbi:MAG: sigma-54-dependent Fis family transcriptional regulator [Gemmatimonadetes bacterium]|nr:sigma-54-dependent Fis family transcriptional regulator [Gemmatimonadota bacterium]MCH8935902.1 sigma-54-dependent Fis family transcriptional regulator [Gemmatimonadota bacterium]